MHDEGVVLLVERDVRAQEAFDPRPQCLVVLMALDPSEAREQAPGVGVDHEHRPVEGVEQDVVGGLRADPVNREQIGADRLGVARL